MVPDFFLHRFSFKTVYYRESQIGHQNEIAPNMMSQEEILVTLLHDSTQTVGRNDSLFVQCPRASFFPKGVEIDAFWQVTDLFGLFKVV